MASLSVSETKTSSRGETIVVPDDFYCPITGELMVRPVIDQFGHSYEEEALKAWHQINPISPLTRQPLEIGRVRPNRSLKNAIDQIRNKITEKQRIKRVHELKCDPQILSNIKKSLEKIDFDVVFRDNKLLLTIHVPHSKKRRPVDIVVVLDISGSMGTDATIKDEHGKDVSHGYNILNICTAAIKTISHSMEAGDNMGVVSFHSQAKVETTQDGIETLIPMDKANQTKIDTIVDSLYPQGCTNLWDGIYKGLELLRKNSSEGRIKYLLVLTDGLPTKSSEPPRGYLGMLEKYKETYPDFDFILDTAGFGYSLDSVLLEKIANAGSGDYAFIPDSSLTGNIFTHKASKIMTTAVTDCVVKFELENGVEFSGLEPCMGHANKFAKTSWGGSLSVGNLGYGQTRHFVIDIKMNDPEILSSQKPYARVSINYSDGENTKVSEKIASQYVNSSIEFDHQLMRLETVAFIKNSLELFKYQGRDAVRDELVQLITKYKSSYLSNDEFTRNLLVDLEDQIWEAFNLSDRGSSENYHQRWGQHWLLSILGAHNTETCNNWKDKGVSNYLTPLFKEYRDKISDIFDTLPPPKKTNNYASASYGSSYRGASAYSGAIRTPSPVDYSVYNQSDGPCFKGSCQVLMADGSSKSCEDIIAGDDVKTVGEKGVSKIVCKTKTKCQDNSQVMVILDNLVVTPYHPIKTHPEAEWQFPSQLGEVKNVQCDHIYSFLTDTRESMIIEGYSCATFGHNLKGPVIGHAYYGTEKIVDDLKKMEGWDSGEVVITKDMIHRDPETNLVVSIR